MSRREGEHGPEVVTGNEFIMVCVETNEPSVLLLGSARSIYGTAPVSRSKDRVGPRGPRVGVERALAIEADPYYLGVSLSGLTVGPRGEP